MWNICLYQYICTAVKHSHIRSVLLIPWRMGYTSMMHVLYNRHPSWQGTQTRGRHGLCPWTRSHCFYLGLQSLVGAADAQITQHDVIHAVMERRALSCKPPGWVVTLQPVTIRGGGVVSSEGWVAVSGNEGCGKAEGVIHKACVAELQKPIYVWEWVFWECCNLRTFLERARSKYVWGDRLGSRAVEDDLPRSFLSSTGNKKSWKAFGQRTAMLRAPESFQLHSESQRRIIWPLYAGHLDVSYP